MHNFGCPGTKAIVSHHVTSWYRAVSHYVLTCGCWHDWGRRAGPGVGRRAGGLDVVENVRMQGVPCTSVRANVPEHTSNCH